MKKARAMYIPAGGKTAVWGPIDQNVLPEGVPFVKTVYDEWGEVTVECVGGQSNESFRGIYFNDANGTRHIVKAGQRYRCVLDGVEYTMTAIARSSFAVVGRDIETDGDNTPFYLSTAHDPDNNFDSWWALYLYDTTPGPHTFSVAEIVEEVHPIDKRCLPKLTSPNGTNYQLTVSDDGTLSAVAVS